MSGYPVVIMEDNVEDYRYVVSPSQRSGAVISFPIDDQSDTIGWVSASDPGAISVRITYSPSLTAGVADATGVAMLVVFSTANNLITSGEADTLMDAAAGDGAGGEYDSVGYIRIPIGSYIERSFVNDDNLLKTVYVRSLVAEAGASLLEIEMTEPE